MLCVMNAIAIWVALLPGSKTSKENGIRNKEKRMSNNLGVQTRTDLPVMISVVSAAPLLNGRDPVGLCAFPM